jgi:SmpA / OmlA family
MRSLMRRWWIWVLAIVLAGGGALPLCYYLILPKVQATRDNYEKIRRGMNEQEVEAILGGPPGDYTTGPWRVELREAWDKGHTRRLWISDSGRIAVFFDQQGLARSAAFVELHVDELPIIERILYKIKKLKAPRERID